MRRWQESELESQEQAGWPPSALARYSGRNCGRFHQRSWAGVKALEPRSCAPSPPTDKDVRMARKVLEPVKDEHLKAVLQRILEKDRQLKCRRQSDPKAP